MMEIYTAVVLGIVQGLTEFLPVSSSAHLILIPWIFGWDPEGLIFDVSLHLGTAAAVLAYFWRDWVLLARETVMGLFQRDPFGTPARRLAWFLAVGTLPAFAAGLLFEKTVENTMRSPLITVVTLIVFGWILYAAERKSTHAKSLWKFGMADSVWIGISQAVALIPGVSRSGITMSAALFRNADRASAARFSFLLSTPVIVGAGLLQVWKLYRVLAHGSGVTSDLLGTTPGNSLMVLAVGTIVAATTGILCIRFFLRYIQTKSFMPFVVYRFALAIAVLIVYLTHMR